MAYQKWSKTALNKKWRRIFTNLARQYNKHTKKVLPSANTSVGMADSYLLSLSSKHATTMLDKDGNKNNNNAAMTTTSMTTSTNHRH